MDSAALTKIQSTVIITIILLAVLGGSVAYVIWTGTVQPAEDIRIGVCTDLGNALGDFGRQQAVLAAEQINAQGGILGRNITIVAEDDDSFGATPDLTVGINALTKLITVDKADYIVSPGGVSLLAYQDVCCQHEKIFFSIANGADEYSQRVLDNYEKYKYSFRTNPLNNTAISALMLGEVIAAGECTGFTKVALLFDDFPMGLTISSYLSRSLPDHGFEVVYNSTYAYGITTDFTSYFAVIEASEAEILVPFMLGVEPLIFVKEWCDRQSPSVVWGTMGMAATNIFWDLTEGKCDTVCFSGSPVVAGYPLTSKTLPFREAYIQRWGEVPFDSVIYDTIRFVLAEAIRRAGTTEAEAVIKTLEAIDVETASTRHFLFTSSHDILVEFESITQPSDEYSLRCYFQWQNGTQVPVYPKQLMEEAGVAFKYPPWQGPWKK